MQYSALRRWAYPVAVATLVVIASSRSAVESGVRIENFDKVVHFSVYGLLGTLVLRALGGSRWGWAIVAVSLFGVSDEIHQYFTPGRSMEFGDWVADTLGATVAVTAYRQWTWYRGRLEKPLFARPAMGGKTRAVAMVVNAV